MEQKRKNNKFKAVLVIELLCLLFFMLRCFGSCASITFDKNSFELNTDREFSSFGDDAVGIEIWPDMQSQQPEGFEMLNCRVSLRSGAYSVKVFYDSASSQDSVSIDNSAGSLSFHTENGAALKANTLQLTDGLNETESRFWLRPGLREREVSLTVQHNGTGKLAVSMIQIEEKRIYRVVLCIAAAFFMAFCNFLYLVFVREWAGRPSLKTRWIIAGILGITVSAGITFFTDFLFINTGHDLKFHISRIISLAESLRETQIPHRMQFEMLNGYGYASPLFYGELFLLLPAVLYNCYVPIQTCYQIFATVTNLCTCLISFWCFTKMTHDWKKGMFGSFLYTLSAYRMINVLLRAAVGEYTAMTFLPLFVYGIWNIYSKREDEKIGLKEYLPIVLAATGLVNSHILSCEMTAMFVLLFVFLRWEKTFQINIFMALVKSCVLSLLLNLWFVVPFLMSMRMDINMKHVIIKMENRSVYPVQLFGIFHTISGSGIDGGVKQEMPLALGLPLVLGIVLFLAVYISKDVWELHQDKNMKAAKLCMALGMTAVFLASSFCWWDTLWDISKSAAGLATVVQFPWRYLGMASALLIPMLLFLLQVLEKHISKRAVLGIMAGITAAAVLTEGYFIMGFTDVQDEIRLYSKADLGTMQVMGAEYKLTGTDLEKYKWKYVQYEEGIENTSFHYDKNGTYYLSCENKSGHASFVDVPVQMYDHYHAYYGDTELAISRGDNNRIRIELPADFAGTICLQYKVPVLWRLCEAASCLSFFVMLGILAKKKR